MKVQNRLSLYSSLVFGIIFGVVELFTYRIFYQSTENSIYKNLQKTAYLTAIFYLEKDELSSNEFSKVKQQFDEKVDNSYYQLYNERDSVCYGSHYLKVDSKYLQKIRNNDSLAFSDNGFLCYGIYYEDNQGNFVVVSREKKDIITSQLNLLIWILFIVYLLGMIAIILLNKLVSNIAYRPFRNIIEQVKSISTNNLDVQIKSPNTKDELQDLTETFNELLIKISETFVIQRNFVSYVSHEFRTPLTSLLGNLEVFSLKDRTSSEYSVLSQKLISQVVQLEETLDALIVVSDLRNNSDIHSRIRIDEIIWQITTKISQQNANADIAVNIDIAPEDEAVLIVQKDRTQLLMALFNMIENAVKFSEGKTVDVSIFKKEQRLCLSIIDHGIGISPENLINISKPFYRAPNTDHILGSGIGLSIALRILEKNGIKYTINSEIGHGTKILIQF